MDEVVEIEIPTDGEEEWRELRESALDSDVEIVEVKGLEPFTTLIIVGGIFAIAGVVAKWIRRQRDSAAGRGYGQIIDLRAGAVDPVRRDPDLDYGQIVIITPTSDGADVKVTIETYDPDNDFVRLSRDVFGKLAEGVLKSVNAVKQAVESATGDRGHVTADVVATPSG